MFRYELEFNEEQFARMLVLRAKALNTLFIVPRSNISVFRCQKRLGRFFTALAASGIFIYAISIWIVSSRCDGNQVS